CKIQNAGDCLGHRRVLLRQFVLHSFKADLADLYSRKVNGTFFRRNGINRGEMSLCKRGGTANGQRCSEITISKIAMALPAKRGHGSEAEDFESDQKTVKFVVMKRHEEDRARKADLASFEAAILPHLDAAHNLARWLLRNEQDAQDVVQEAYLRAFKSFDGFHGSNGRAWLLTIVRNTFYTLEQGHSEALVS